MMHFIFCFYTECYQKAEGKLLLPSISSDFFICYIHCVARKTPNTDTFYSYISHIILTQLKFHLDFDFVLELVNSFQTKCFNFLKVWCSLKCHTYIQSVIYNTRFLKVKQHFSKLPSNFNFFLNKKIFSGLFLVILMYGTLQRRFCLIAGGLTEATAKKIKFI